MITFKDKYCNDYKGGKCERVNMHVPRRWCFDVCKGKPETWQERRNVLGRTGQAEPKHSQPLTDFDKKRISLIKDELTSVLIPARSDIFLNKTINSIFSSADGPIEVIAILDSGFEQRVDDRATVIAHKDPVGMRASLNEGARRAKGKYLFLLDAHCTMSKGWDTKLKCACEEKTLVASSLKALCTKTWTPKKAVYTFVAINRDWEVKWWCKYKQLKDCKQIEETMALTGCGWMIEKSYFWQLGGCDESLGEIKHTGAEWSLKVWLHPEHSGRLLLRTDVFCAHAFETNKKDRLFKPKTISDKEFGKKMSELYGNRIQTLVAKFKPPHWEEVSAVETKETVRITHRTKIKKTNEYEELTANLPWVTCYLLYYGRYELAQEATECFLAQTYPNKKLLIINDHPDPVWFDEDCPNIEIQNHPPNTFENLNDKYNYAFSQIKTPYFTPWDDDDIVLPWHLTNLVAGMLQIPFKDTPRKVGIRCRYSWKSGAIRGFGGKMWGCCLFDTFDKDGNRFPQCDPQQSMNADRQINNQRWEQHWIDMAKYPLSFIYRWGTGEGHGSSHKGQRAWDHCKKLRKIKYALPLKEPWRPHWKTDYVEDVRTFLNTVKEVPKIKNEVRGCVKPHAYLNSQALLNLLPEDAYCADDWEKLARALSGSNGDYPGNRKI